MIPVYQTTFRGPAAPLEEQGNCGAAVIASLLELSLEEAFDVRDYSDEEWWDYFILWLKARELGAICIEAYEGGPPGYTIAHTMTPNGIPHVVVTLDGKIVHDPASLPDPGPIGQYTIIYPLDVAKVNE